MASGLTLLSPDPSFSGSFWGTLGGAHYRAGKPQEAFAALEKAMPLRSGGNSYNWFFLAMAHWQLEHKAKPRTSYKKAVEWMEKNKPNNEELVRFRAEAEELLDVKKKESGDRIQKKGTARMRTRGNPKADP